MHLHQRRFQQQSGTPASSSASPSFPPPPPASSSSFEQRNNNNSDDQSGGCVVVSVSPPPQLSTSSSSRINHRNSNDPSSSSSSTASANDSDYSSLLNNNNYNNTNNNTNATSSLGTTAASSSSSFPASPALISSSPSSPGFFNSISSFVSNNHIQNLVAREGTVLSVVYRRLSVLVSLLLLQSMSQFVLEAFEPVVQANIVIPLFLTMLVGAGGNAGNQSAVRAIAMLAKGEINGSKLSHVLPVIKRECVIGLICALVLSSIGALRVFVHQKMRMNRQNNNGGNDLDNGAAAAAGGSFENPSLEHHQNQQQQQAGIAVTVLAISTSLFAIVALSAVIGVALPFIFIRFGASAEHAAPAIQVIMDVLGVFLTCLVCSLLLPSSSSSSTGSAAAKPP